MRRPSTLRAAAALTIALGALPSCDNAAPDNQQAQAPRPAPAPPPPARPVDTAVLLQSEGADARVQFPQSKAPTDADLARAVTKLADALARGDASVAEAMLSAGDRETLADLRRDGRWQAATAGIETVRVAQLTDEQLTLAVQDERGAYPLVWSIAREGGEVRFAGVPAPEVVMPSASAFDDGIPDPGARAGGQRRATALPVPTMAEFQSAVQAAGQQAIQGYEQNTLMFTRSLSPVGFYASWSLSLPYSRAFAGEALTEDVALGATAMGMGKSADELRAMLTEGKAAADAGTLPEPAEMLGLVEQWTRSPVLPIDERRVVAAYADALGVEPSAVQALLESARADGLTSPFSE